MPKTQKNAKLDKKKQIFHCECCDFTTCKKSNYKKHLATRKHQRGIFSGNDFEKKMPIQKKCQNQKHKFVNVERNLAPEVVCGNIKKIVNLLMRTAFFLFPMFPKMFPMFPKCFLTIK
tara:strand:+ start:208 stop:561 length:354 start_codon:yes stop_codon:yes gene_type:complete